MIQRSPPASRSADAGPINAVNLLKSVQTQANADRRRGQSATSDRKNQLVCASQRRSICHQVHRMPQP